ncbi:BrnT family toxin [Paraglaciecola sp. L3A3]|uniref:BrnT family toxin n=1 Tax=Paraglaciecola sp. L3A3 TaxID=2686358 RepID=UPI00131EBABC|nr:BrnT family toxin [Paraglaciecola sp. L3A3]
MKIFDWNPDKNKLLIEERGISFEDVIYYLQNNCLLDDLKHSNQKKYPNQRIFVINIENYAYLVPYIETDIEIFLKTVIPSRKATKLYIGDQ